MKQLLLSLFAAFLCCGAFAQDVPDYVCLTAEEDGSLKLSTIGPDTTRVIEYSTDLATWQAFRWGPGKEVSIPVSNGDKVYLRGKNEQLNSGSERWGAYMISQQLRIKPQSKMSVSGNIMTLLDYENPSTTLEGKPYAFARLFQYDANLTSAKDLKLPATVLSVGCYAEMFSDSKSLVDAPELPATTLATNCYAQMFSGCEALASATYALPATTLAEDCYDRMFYYCTSLTTAPEIAATTLAEECCSQMFAYCESLEKGPSLPATDLVKRCYYRMFYKCTKLNSLSVGFTDWGEKRNSSTKEWLSDVAKTGTFTCPASLDVTTNQDETHVPTGWTANVATGISQLPMANNKESKRYNLQGISVGKNYHGIVIQNGKKIMN